MAIQQFNFHVVFGGFFCIRCEWNHKEWPFPVKATEQYFPVVFFITLTNMRLKTALTMHTRGYNTIKCRHLNESYTAFIIISWDEVYFFSVLKEKKSFVNLALKRDKAFPVHDLIAPLYAASTWGTTNKETSVPPKDCIAKQYNAWRFLKRRNSLWKQRIIAWQILFDDKSYPR